MMAALPPIMRTAARQLLLNCHKDSGIRIKSPDVGILQP